MKTTPKIAVLIAICSLGALLIAGCGGSEADSDTDPQELLDKTFGGGEAQVDSGVLDVSIDASASGDGGGALTGTLTGPFQTRADDELPLIDLAVSLQVEGSGDNTDIQGGLTVTEDAGFVTVDGQAYAVDDATFTTFADLFAQSAAQQAEAGDEGSAVFDTLGIDPAGWLTDVTNEGTEEVGGVETVHISGTADVAKIVADAEALDPTGGAVGTPGGGELADAVTAASVDVFTGAEDNILRQLDLTVEIADPEQQGDGLSLSLSLGISGVNEQQSFDVPTDTKPLEELLPGGLGAIAGGAGEIVPGGTAPQQGGGGAGGGGNGGGGGAGGLGDFQECVDNAQTPEDFADCSAQ